MKNKFANIVANYWPFFLFIGVFIGIFYKVFLYGLVPFPGDLLVSGFFPYNSGGWEGFSPWITHKEYIAADVVRQLYIWRVLAMDYIKMGIMPLWNPYSFAGTVFLANMQSGVFYPFNILFFIFNERTAWVIYTMMEPIISFWSMYAFIRSIGLSRQAGFFCGLAFPFMGIMTMQFEWATVVHAMSWIPFILYGINEYAKSYKKIYIFYSLLGLTFSLFAGYIQPTAYVLIISVAYYCYLFVKKYKKSKKEAYVFLKGILFIPLSLGIAAIQLIPLLEAYSLSSRNSFMAQLFHTYQFAPLHLLTLFAPDFFGNPATNNFWGTTNYAENMAYIGIVTLFFSVIAIWYQRNNPLVRLFLAFGILGLLLALPTPLSELILTLKVMVLSTGVPARAIFITQFALVVLSGFGIDYFFANKKKLWIVSVLFFILYVSIWMGIFALSLFTKNEQLLINLSIAKRNLFLPSIIAFILVCIPLIKPYVHKKRVILFLIIVIFSAFEYQRFMYKYASFSPTSYIFPSHPLITYLQKTVKNNRIYGYDTASFQTNIPTYWKLQFPEGFDSAYPKRYGELVFATHKGVIEKEIARSDVYFKNSLPRQDSYAKQVVMNILGIKYTIDKDDNPPSLWSPRLDRFPGERYRLIWQKNKWQVYENKAALPRALIFYDAITLTNDKQIISTLFDKKFSYRSRLIIEDAHYGVKQFTHRLPSEATILRYEPNKIIIKTNAVQKGLLFLSDMYYPGWKAYVDGKEKKIYRADYSFRAVNIDQGKHIVEFVYEPFSFTLGLLITCISIITSGLLFGLGLKNTIYDNET